MGFGGAALGLVLFGTQGAGIAALGAAIGVPLWIVFGAGAAFLGVLYEEITRKTADKTEGVEPVFQADVTDLSSSISWSTPKLISSETGFIDVEIIEEDKQWSYLIHMTTPSTRAATKDSHSSSYSPCGLVMANVGSSSDRPLIAKPEMNQRLG